MRQRTFIASRDDAEEARAVVRSIYADTPAMDPLIRNPEVTMGLELRNYLKAVCRGRMAGGLALGSLEGWARAIALASARIDVDVTFASVAKHSIWIGIEIPDAFMETVAREAAAAQAAGALNFDARFVGEMIQLTAAEREEFGIKRLIEACDEDPRERRNRQRRERRGPRQRVRSIASTQPWVKDGYACRRTWERNGKVPKVVSQQRSTTNDIEEEWCSTISATPHGCSTVSATCGGGVDDE